MVDRDMMTHPVDVGPEWHRLPQWMEALTPEGASSDSWIFVSDDMSLCEDFRSRGYDTVGIADIATAHGRPVTIAIADYENLRRATPEIREHMNYMAVLWIPLAAFNAAGEDGAHTLRLLDRSSVREAVARNTAWLEHIRTGAGTMRFSGTGTDVECTIGRYVEVGTRVEGPLKLGDWVSLGTLFEVSLEARQGVPLREDFSVTGDFRAAGITVASDRRATSRGRDRFIQAMELHRSLATEGPIDVTLADGVMISAKTSDRDLTDQLLELTNPQYRLNIVEFAVGTNAQVARDVDWAINSQLNEGALGVHVGIGDGVTAAHIDFVCPSCEYEDSSRSPELSLTA